VVIDLQIKDEEVFNRAAGRAREKGIRVPTFAEMIDPGRIPEPIQKKLSQVGLWDLDPLNLYRITWHNAPVAQGGGFGPVNALEFPPALTGVPARIILLVGKWFPTGAHKVGAAFGCLVPELVTGGFDPTRQKAVWPSTGNYCRGGAYDANLLGCASIAILPEGMSAERFAWLEQVAGDIIKTPGSESNVKEIFDACWELRRSGSDVVIFNQFEQFGNYLWHYAVTGRAMQEVIKRETTEEAHFRGLVLSTGSAGTLGSGDYLKQQYPTMKLAVSEALQCPTLLYNGFGSHRIEGIGDKHVPWIHNVRNTDMVMGIDDAAPIALMRLFNEPAGQEYLAGRGIDSGLIDQLPLLGISGIANLLTAIKFARYYELSADEVVLSIATDSMDLYQSRLAEEREKDGPYSPLDAAGAYQRYLLGAGTEHIQELGYYDRKRIHQLKYFTWIEQQGRTVEELNDQWYDREYWTRMQAQVPALDRRIGEFNARVGV
jgi:cysteine synthase